MNEIMATRRAALRAAIERLFAVLDDVNVSELADDELIMLTAVAVPGTPKAEVVLREVRRRLPADKRALIW